MSSNQLVEQRPPTFVELTEQAMSQFKRGEVYMRMDEKQNKDGSLQRRVEIRPIVMSERIAKWAKSSIMVIVLSFIMYVTIQLVHDIRAHLEVERTQIQINKQHCISEYALNQCDETYSLKSMKQQCQELSLCVQQDEEALLRTKQVWIKVIGGTLENLMAEVSYRTLILFGITVILLIISMR